MIIKRIWGPDHISNSIKQLNENAWLVGDSVLHRSSKLSESAAWNDEMDKSSYSFTAAPNPLPGPARPLDSSHFRLVHEAGDASAVWSIGNSAFCKVRFSDEDVTPKQVTLEFVRRQRPSFKTPEVFHYTLGADRSFLFLRRLPGRTLDVAWPTLNRFWQRHYVETIANICQEMAGWSSLKVGSVNNKRVPEYFLVTPAGSDDFDSLLTGYKAIGLDCSSFVFYHADLGPKNIIVESEPRLGKVGILDYEICGYFRRGWVRTKFRLSSGMDLSSCPGHQWRAEVQKALEARGFQDHSQAWIKWRGYT